MEKIDSVPWIYAFHLDSSKQAYFATYREVKDITTFISDKFQGKVVVGNDKALRGYYIFVK